MKRKVTAAVSIIVIIILGGVTILSILGKPFKVKTDTKLNGVNEDVCMALYYASLAANSHNSQGWKLKLNAGEQQITIFLDEERALDAADPKRRELYISLGCYIQSMTFAFDAYGYDTTVDYAESLGESNEIAAVSYRMRENAEASSDKIAVIKRRHTDKSEYKTDKLSPETLTKLLEDCNGIYCFEIGSEAFEYLKNGTLEAITKQSEQSAYREELNLWMRFSNQETEEKKDGISAEMIGLTGIVKTFYYLTTNHGNAENDTFARQGIRTAENQVENCSAFFVITGNDTIIDWIEAGRKTQDFWYKCVDNNIAIQPLSAMLETAPYNQDIQKDLGLSENVQMILRAGYVKDYGENAGVRRSLNEYITVVN